MIHTPPLNLFIRDILSSDFGEVQLKAVVTNFDKRHSGSKYYVSTLVWWCETASGAHQLAVGHVLACMALYVLEKLPICIISSTLS